MATISTAVQPFLLQNGFNNIVVMAIRQGGDDDDSCYLDVRDNATGRSITLKRFWENGENGEVSVFNIRNIVKYFFDYNHRSSQYMTADQDVLKHGSVIRDRGLYAEYSFRVRSGGNIGAWQNRLAFNSVSQFERGTVDMSEFYGQFLTKQKKIVKYPGLPLVLSFMNFKNRNAFVVVDGKLLDGGVDRIGNPIFPVNLTRFDIAVPDGVSDVLITNEDVSSTYRFLATNNNNRVATNAGSSIIVGIAKPSLDGVDFSKQVIDLDNCNFSEDVFYERYFYVRWINDIGGWEYMLFSFRTFEEHELKDQTKFVRHIPRNFVTDFEQPNSKELARTITCGASGLDKQEFDRIREILKSPRIETFSATRKKWELENAQTGQLFSTAEIHQVNLDGEGIHGWIPITVNSGIFEKNTRETKQICEIIFNLPPAQLQF